MLKPVARRSPPQPLCAYALGADTPYIVLPIRDRRVGTLMTCQQGKEDLVFTLK